MYERKNYIYKCINFRKIAAGIDARAFAHAQNCGHFILQTPLTDGAAILCSFSPFDLNHLGGNMDATEASEKFLGV